MAKSAATTKPAIKDWRVVTTVELAAPARKVWEVVGGFYTIHLWHPDIALSEVPPNQAQLPELRRLLTFPGQPTTTEELVMIDNADFHYTYKWHAGAWGEKVQNYVADLRVLELDLDKTCIVQWSSTFTYTEDALTEFYWNGFRALQKRFGVPKKSAKSK